MRRESDVEMLDAAPAFVADGSEHDTACDRDESTRTLGYATPSEGRRFFLFRMTVLERLLICGLLGLISLFALPALEPQGCPCRPRIANTITGENGPISQAIDLFEYHVGRYPRSFDELSVIASGDPDRAKWKGPYLTDAASLIDPWGNTIRYDASGRRSGGDYDLWSVGPNGVDESSDGDGDFGDDFRNW